jgi:RNA polymerase sigma factor (sigma-70 family)
MAEGEEGDARSDAELLRAAREDPDSFRVLYDRYAKRVHQFFERRTRDREVSLDLTSETFARAWLARAKFRDLADGSAGPWLFAIARSVLIRSVEKLRLETDARRRLGLLAERALLEPEPDERWLDGLDQALDALPDGQRDAVRLRVIEGLSYGEVGRALDCSATAARIRVSRGLSTLRMTIEGAWL